MISVIIPMYNAENTIIQALDSIRNQTYKSPFEIIVINDGSTDNSQSKVENYHSQFPELNLNLIQQENQGVSVARNKGLKSAKGEYIAFLDADDKWLPNKIERQMFYLDNPNYDIDFLVTLRNDEKIWFPYKINFEKELAEITLKKLLIRIDGQTSTALFKRKIIDNTGFFDENQKYSEDANYWMRISQNNKMYILAESLVVTGSGKKSFGESGLSANLKEMEKGIQKNIREMFQNKRINLFEYLLFYGYSKFKYLVRPIRAKL